MTINFSQYLNHQTLEETIQVLDDILLILVIHTEEHGISENLSHQYLTIRNLRDTFSQALANKDE